MVRKRKMGPGSSGGRVFCADRSGAKTRTIGSGLRSATVGAEHSSTGRVAPHLPLPYRKIISVFLSEVFFL